MLSTFRTTSASRAMRWLRRKRRPRHRQPDSGGPAARGRRRAAATRSSSYDFRYIDNAINPAYIRARNTDAWNFFTPIVLSGIRTCRSRLAATPAMALGPAPRSMAWRTRSRDFYSHTNWVDDNVAVAQPGARMPPAAAAERATRPLCPPPCTPDSSRSTWSTPCRAARRSACRQALHLDSRTATRALNKDAWDTPRGIQAVPRQSEPADELLRSRGAPGQRRSHHGRFVTRRSACVIAECARRMRAPQPTYFRSIDINPAGDRSQRGEELQPPRLVST